MLNPIIQSKFFLNYTWLSTNSVNHPKAKSRGVSLRIRAQTLNFLETVVMPVDGLSYERFLISQETEAQYIACEELCLGEWDTVISWSFPTRV